LISYSKLSIVILKLEYIMLEALYVTKSKIRQGLFALFFTNPSKKDNLFHTEKIGNLLYYSLNAGHPLFDDLKNIISKTVGVEGSLRNILSSIEQIKVAFVYGSFASKLQKATSDIDLMVIGNPDISNLNEKIAILEKRLKRDINITIYSWEEYKPKKESHSGFILDLLKNPKIMLIGKEDDL